MTINARQSLAGQIKQFSLRFSGRIVKTVACLTVLVVSNASGQAQDTVTTFNYDNVGNVTAVNGPLGRTTTYSYNALNQVAQESETVGSSALVTKPTYDALGQITSVMDPRNLVTSYTIDGLGNQSQLSSPDTQSSSYTVDEMGNVLTSTDARGKTTRYQYDALDRLLHAQYQTGTPSRFEYDGGPGGPASEIGNLTRITDESGYTTFTHDMKGRVLAKTQVVTAGGTTAQFTVQYTYGTSGTSTSKLETMTYPTGSRVTYRYDENGRVNTITLLQGAGTSEVPLLTNITYTPSGDIQSWQWGSSGSPTYKRTYDLDGRLTSYPVDLLGTVRMMTYNAGSLVTAYKHSGGPNPSQYDETFNYDAADRLSSFTLGGVATTYSYDANGNRTQQTSPNVTYNYTPSSNRLSSASFSIPRSYTYDAAGNRTGDGLYTYTYSDRGRLAQVGSSTQLNIYYNALGQRVLKLGTTGATGYVYDEDGHTIGEYAQSTLVGTETVYLGDLPIAVVTPQRYFYVLADQIHTPLVLAQPDATTVWDWRNRDPFGNNAPVASSVLPRYDHRFPGQIADPETGLFYNYFRDYDPQTGRYIESDPIGLSGGVNTYGYAKGNPISGSDQYGLEVCFYSIITGRTCFGPPPSTVDPYNQSLPGTQHFWPKVVRDAWDKLANICLSDVTPPVPGDLVGDQSDPRAGTSNSGKRHTSGPLAPGNGGTGDAEKDFDKLTGGTGKPFPDSDSRSKIPGAQVGDNGVWIRPGTKKPGDGPRIEIPGNGSKLPETLHY